jgi:hypothetical protein
MYLYNRRINSLVIKYELYALIINEVFKVDLCDGCNVCLKA